MAIPGDPTKSLRNIYPRVVFCTALQNARQKISSLWSCLCPTHRYQADPSPRAYEDTKQACTVPRVNLQEVPYDDRAYENMRLGEPWKIGCPCRHTRRLAAATRKIRLKPGLEAGADDAGTGSNSIDVDEGSNGNSKQYC